MISLEDHDNLQKILEKVIQDAGHGLDVRDIVEQHLLPNKNGYNVCTKDIEMEYTKSVEALSGKTYFFEDGVFIDESGDRHYGCVKDNRWFRPAWSWEVPEEVHLDKEINKLIQTYGKEQIKKVINEQTKEDTDDRV